MIRNTMCGGRALSIAVGITMLVLLMAGGAQARFDLNISPHSDINNSFIMHRLDAEITSNRDSGIQENKKLLPVKGIEKAAVMISAKAGWFISDTETGGDCNFIGTWNIISKTCTLTTDLNKTIVIDSDNIILDGNSHTITGSSSEYGIYLSGRSGVTIKNTNVRYFYDGIYLHDSNNNTLKSNNALNNTYGIYLYYSSNNNLFNNTMKENSYNFVVYGESGSDFNNQIDSSNTVDGKPIYYVINAKNTVYDSSTKAGFFYCISCLNVTIKDMELLKNDVGILFWNTTFSKIQNVTVSKNYDGIILLESGNNTLTGNNVNSNNDDGIDLYDSSNNKIYNNVFNNTNNLYIEDSVSVWNINKTSGTNIIGGSYLGGNFWTNPSGTGISQTCADANSDGICDSAYTIDSYNIDYLPLAYTSVTPTPTIPIEIPLPINATSGIVNTTIIVAAPSANLTMTIPNGTRVSDATGKPLTQLTNLSIITASGLTANATTALNDRVILGQVVDLRPNGTRFDTPVQIRFNYTLTNNVDENSLIVKYFNTASNSWEEMQTVERNTAQHYIIANISHFSTFALVGTPVSSTSSSGGSSSVGTYPPGYNTITKAVQATATAVQTAIATATPVVAKTEVPAATTAKPEATGTTKASEPATPGFGAIIAVFAVAMIASLLKNNRNRR